MEPLPSFAPVDMKGLVDRIFVISTDFKRLKLLVLLNDVRYSVDLGLALVIILLLFWRAVNLNVQFVVFCGGY